MSIPAAARPLLLVPVAAVSAAMLATAHDPPLAAAPLDYLFDAATGVVLVIAGLLAWSRLPGRRTGPLLVLAGYLWYVGSLYELAPEASFVPFLGFAFRGYYDVILAAVVLAFPGDALGPRRYRLAVGFLAGSMAVRTGWRLIGTQPGVGTGNAPSAPPNPVLLFHDVRTFIEVDVWLTLVVGIALFVVAGMALDRLRRVRPGARWVTDPVLVGGALWAGLAGIYTVAIFLEHDLGLSIVPSDGPGWTVQYVLRTLGPLGLVIGILRLRGRSAAVVASIAGRDGPPRGPELEDALRAALDDPSLVLLYPAADGGWADAAGAGAQLPALTSGRAATILEADGRVCGAVVHDATLLDDPTVIRTMAAVVRLAVDNERLQADLRAQLEEVRASRARIVEAADAERRRVERDLHDGAQQRLVALAVSLRTIRRRLGPDVRPEVASELEAAAGEVRAAIAELRELAQGLDPAILREAGLGAAVQSLADRSPVPVQVDLRMGERLPSRVETAAYFVASEALANVAKHSRASRATVRAQRLDDWLQLEVIDDGIGGADLNGAGLRGLVDRIAAVDGLLTLRSAPGNGTSILVAIPCAS